MKILTIRWHNGFGSSSYENTLIAHAFQNVQMNGGYRMRPWQLGVASGISRPSTVRKVASSRKPPESGLLPSLAISSQWIAGRSAR